jgi:tetratricopeptide (TPR) repeat protein
MKTILIGLLALLCLAVVSYAQEEAIDIKSLQDKISTANDSAAVKLLLTLNQAYYQNQKTDEALAYYRVLAQQHRGSIVEAAAICLSVPRWLKQQSYIEVRDKCIYVKESFKNTTWAAECLYNLGEMYLNVNEDKAIADTYFQELVTDYPRNGLAEIARNYLGNN